MKPRAVIFDIDGTIADIGHRCRMVQDWINVTDAQVAAYSARMDDDRPILPMVELARTLHTAGFAILLLTARDDSQYQRTKDWMKSHGVPFEQLYMREQRKPGEVWTPNAEYKLDQLNVIRKKYDIEFAVDDEPKVVKMFRDNGITCLQCADWSTGDDSHAQAARA